METARLALHAMATRFELILHGEDAGYLRAAGEAALGEISRLEAQLSFYRPASDIRRINACAASGPVSVEPQLFELLKAAKQLYHQTDGAFDITIGPLMRCWGFVNDTGHLPVEDRLAEARSRTGMHLVHLDTSRRTIIFEKPGVEIDLGGIGKGYAIDEAIFSLTENGIESALLHGGTSTMHAIGRPPGGEMWKTMIPSPQPSQGSDMLAVVELENESMSVSAPSGKSFVADGKVYGHVLDPRTGYPVAGAALTAVVASSAMVSDVLSTALLVQGTGAVDEFADRFSVHALAAAFTAASFVANSFNEENGRLEVTQSGIPLYQERTPVLSEVHQPTPPLN